MGLSLIGIVASVSDAGNLRVRSARNNLRPHPERGCECIADLILRSFAQRSVSKDGCEAVRLSTCFAPPRQEARLLRMRAYLAACTAGDRPGGDGATTIFRDRDCLGRG